jgi:hypothetical protein
MGKTDKEKRKTEKEKEEKEENKTSLCTKVYYIYTKITIV